MPLPAARVIDRASRGWDRTSRHANGGGSPSQPPERTTIATPTITDKPLLRRRLARTLRGSRPQADFLLNAAVAEMAERLAGVERRFATAIAFGGAGAGLGDALMATGKIGAVYRMERHEAAFEAGACGVVADEEALPLAAESIDLFVAPLTLQWTNDMPGALAQIRKALRPDGLLLAAMTGGGTLSELRDSIAGAEAELWGGASPRVLPTADVRDLGGLLQRAGFTLPVADRDVLTVRYDTAFGLFDDLRRMGASNVLVERARRPTSRRLLARTAEIYAERFSDPDGRVRATFEIVSLSGWAPHESQQKPAQRGSGAVSLANVLGKKI